MDILIVFLFGVLCGSSTVMGYGWYQIQKIKKTKSGLLDQIKNRVKDEMLKEKGSSIKDRLVRASEIATTQMNLRSQMEMPSKNALHSRHKNGLGGEIVELEHEKLDLLKSILAEGYNPLITVINEAGATEEIPLSAFVDQALTALMNSGYGTPPPPSDGEQPRKAGKFVVYKGGKDDGTTH